MASFPHDSDNASIQMDSSFSGEEVCDSTGSVVVDVGVLDNRRLDHNNVILNNGAVEEVVPLPEIDANCNSGASENYDAFGRCDGYTRSDINNNNNNPCKQVKSTQCDFKPCKQVKSTQCDFQGAINETQEVPSSLEASSGDASPTRSQSEQLPATSTSEYDDIDGKENSDDAKKDREDDEDDDVNDDDDDLGKNDDDIDDQDEEVYDADDDASDEDEDECQDEDEIDDDNDVDKLLLSSANDSSWSFNSSDLKEEEKSLLSSVNDSNWSFNTSDFKFSNENNSHLAKKFKNRSNNKKTNLKTKKEDKWTKKGTKQNEWNSNNLESMMALEKQQSRHTKQAANKQHLGVPEKRELPKGPSMDPAFDARKAFIQDLEDINEAMQHNEQNVESRTNHFKGLAVQAERLAEIAEAFESNAGKLKNVFCCDDYAASVKLYGLVFGTIGLAVVVYIIYHVTTTSGGGASQNNANVPPTVIQNLTVTTTMPVVQVVTLKSQAQRKTDPQPTSYDNANSNNDANTNQVNKNLLTVNTVKPPEIKTNPNANGTNSVQEMVISASLIIKSMKSRSNATVATLSGATAATPSGATSFDADTLGDAATSNSAVNTKNVDDQNDDKNNNNSKNNNNNNNNSKNRNNKINNNENNNNNVAQIAQSRKGGMKRKETADKLHHKQLSRRRKEKSDPIAKMIQNALKILDGGDV